MKIAIDAVGIRGHGGAAVLVELLHWLPIVRPDWHWHVFLFERRLREFDDPKVSERVAIEHVGLGDSGWQRLKWVNRYLPERVRELGADVLFSFANIAPVKPIVPQVVLCHQHNAFFGEGIPLRMFLLRARFRFMRRQILRGARASRAVIVQTNSMHQRMSQIDPRIGGRIHVIPSGYRTRQGIPVIRPEVRECIESLSRPRLIYISVPRLHKNHVNLIKAFNILLSTFPKASLILTKGQLNPHDSNHRKIADKIEHEIKKLGISENVFWFEWLTPDEVDYAHASSDLSVFPSLAESFGLPLAEAIKVCCPIAAANLPYAHDVAGDAAVYFDPHDPASIAQCIIETLNQSKTIDKLKKAAMERSKIFNYETIAGRIAHVIELIQ